MIIHNPILTGSFTVNGTDVASITSSAASITAINSYTASQNILNGTYTLTSSFAAQTASFTAFTSSVNSFTASQLVLNGTYATTGSNTFAGIQTVNSNLVVTGSITAQTLVVQTVTSSVIYSSGSNVFGNSLANNQIFTGSLKVTGSIATAGTLAAGAITSTGQFSLSPTSGSSWLYITPGTEANTPYISWLNPSGNRIGLLGSSATNIALGLENSASFTINGGNIGIGTTSPTAIVQIQGAQAGVSGKNLTISYNGTYYAEYTEKSITAFNNELIFGTGTGGAERMRILSTGNIGIGSTAPDAKLTVVGPTGTASGYGNFLVKNTSEAGISFGASSTTYTWIQGNVYGSGTAIVALNPQGGNVGIGTTNPTGNLTVKTGTNFNFRVDNYLSATNIASVNDAASAYAMFNIDGNVVRIQGLNTGGNVCIGTTTDYGYKLNLNGQPGCNGYTAWTNWSDSRLKENITDFDAPNVLNRICTIRPVTYNYNELSGFDEATRARRISGFIAQELMEVFPDMVNIMKRDDGNEYYDTNLSNLNLYLVKAIQELQAQITELKNK